MVEVVGHIHAVQHNAAVAVGVLLGIVVEEVEVEGDIGYGCSLVELLFLVA